ncbi:telomere repeat-binding factor 1-like [Pyrus ussuriensis x Pyrus communis]|uniref:MYB transcription factor n=1 Tax=Pyrus ussuriensis x Pyrus communis TaxID=2448454 RepID=A0A5N5GRF0_9ROSA|nr:telomere repeat-binding factor 1-like [Pyrus ussuriensis x Pyrus communis]
MGAPKQKWTAEEEAALKAGVLKHGAGKWRTILTDPEFNTILHLRSNVDLKDKWRNINVTAIWGSRQKAKLALKRNLPTPKHDNNPLAVSTVIQSHEEVVDAKPLASSGGKSQTIESKDSKQPIARLDHLILEAITNLKEPGGSDRAAIAMHIEEQYWAPPKLKKLLSSKLKNMTATGKLIKVKHRYRIPLSSATSEKRRSSSALLLEGKQKDSLRKDKSDINILTKSQVDADLTKMRSMTAQEAAAAAAQAVAEAEAAIAAAEEAAREAEAAEAEAEAAQVFAKAAMKALKCRKIDLDMKLTHG